VARRLIDFTDDTALRQTIPAALSFTHIRNLVRDALGPDAADMLAEPVSVPAEGRRQWLTEAPLSAPAVRLRDASPLQAEDARRVLADNATALKLFTKTHVRANREHLAGLGKSRMHAKAWGAQLHGRQEIRIRV
jgi:hypothetical protein